MSHTAITINLRKVNTILFLLLIVGAVLYFLTVNNLSTRGFVFKDLRDKNNKLEIEKQRLESKITEFASYQNLNPRIEQLQLVKATDVIYLDSNAFTVARK